MDDISIDPRKRKVMSLEDEMKYLRTQIELLKIILSKKKKVSFEVAFLILHGFEDWKSKGFGPSFRKYLTNFVEAGECLDKFETYKLAYYVARVFDNLEQEENRILAFECYRKIANATLFKNASLSDAENLSKNRFWQQELRREAEGATVIRDDFEDEKLDYEIIFPRLIQKGYVNKLYRVDMDFEEFDDEFKSWFPQYVPEQFEAIKKVLRFQRTKKSKPIASSKLPNRIKEIQRRNKVYVAPEGRKVETATIEYRNEKYFFERFVKDFKPEIGDMFEIRLIPESL